MALRLFNPKTRLLSIYWANSVTVVFDVPQVGSFENKLGRFYARDSFEEDEADRNEEAQVSDDVVRPNKKGKHPGYNNSHG